MVEYFINQKPEKRIYLPSTTNMRGETVNRFLDSKGNITESSLENPWDTTPQQLQQQQQQQEQQKYMPHEHYKNMNLMSERVSRAAIILRDAVDTLKRHEYLLESNKEYRQANIENFRERNPSNSMVREFLTNMQWLKQSIDLLEQEAERYKSL